ncbi:unnamed protein product [marine sediment metagenome]|uniref:Uncharacterized protein n=1 Tax=marine sediment metagenome TaxID=412755 RepID=X1HAZ8_9ZZZZ
MKEYIVIVQDQDGLTTFSLEESTLISALIEIGMTMEGYFYEKYGPDIEFMYKIKSVYVKEGGRLDRITGVIPTTIDKTNVDVLNGKLSIIGTNSNKSVIRKEAK